MRQLRVERKAGRLRVLRDRGQLGASAKVISRVTRKIDFFIRKNLAKLPIPCESMMIVDIKTALDRYLTHSLTRTLDRPSSDFFLLLRGTIRRHTTCKKRDGTHAHDGKTHRPFKTRTYIAPRENKRPRDAKNSRK